MSVKANINALQCNELKISCLKYKRPNLDELKWELENLDVSTNKYHFTIHETIPIRSKHPTLGLIVKQHPDITDAVELVGIRIGTVAHRSIKSWKQRLVGTIVTKINNKEIHSANDIVKATQKGVKEHKQMARIEFATLKVFALHGNGVPTLQTDQLNVIAHHINAIQMMDNNHVSKNIYQEFWPDKTE